MNTTGDLFSIKDYVLWSSSLFIFILYHIIYFIEFKYRKLNTNLYVNLQTRKRMAKKLLSFDGGSILGIQSLRNSMSAAIFYAGSTSTVGFILLKMVLDAQNTGLFYVQQAVLIGCLFFGFLNWLAVIKSWDSATTLIASEEYPKEPTEEDLTFRQRNIKLTGRVLTRGQFHHFLGMRAWYASMITAMWLISGANSILSFFLILLVIVWMYFQDHQFKPMELTPLNKKNRATLKSDVVQQPLLQSDSDEKD